MSRPDPKREETLRKRREGDLALLRKTREDAAQGARLNAPKHLHAALELGRRYRAARAAHGFSEEDLTVAALERLMGTRVGGAGFNIRKLILKRAIDAVTPELCRDLRGKAIPQHGLRHYLAAVRAIAFLGGEDEIEAEISFLRGIRFWDDAPRPQSSEANWTAITTLSSLLQELSGRIAHRHDLLECFRHQHRLAVDLDFFHDRLTQINHLGLTDDFSPLHPWVALGTNFVELRQYPSIPLVWVPMGWVDTRVRVEKGPGRAEPATGPEPNRWEEREVRLIQMREIRLALAPLGATEVGAVLQTRGRVVLTDRVKTWPVSGTSHWLDRWFYPHEIPLEIQDDGWRRVDLRDLPGLAMTEEGHLDLPHLRRNPMSGEAMDWDWEVDPVEKPGYCEALGPDYISFTPMTPDHLHHWLIAQSDLDGVDPICPWDNWHFDALLQLYPAVFPPEVAQTVHGWVRSDPMQSGYLAGLERFALGCPPRSPAQAIEICLHNALLDKALGHAAARTQSETARILEQMRLQSEEARAGLLARWADEFKT